MNLSSNKTLRLIILLFLLGNGSILFLHSELGLLNCDKSNHGVHDFCEIIKISSTISKTVQVFKPNIEIGTIICQHCANESETQIFQNRFERSKDHLIDKQSTQIYLFNKTFLI